MKKLFMFFLFIVITISIWAGQNDILTITHFSPALNQEKTFRIYFPPGAKADEKFPVLFVLHGAYGCYKDWIDRTNIEDLADNYQMILVFPDGGEFGWYADSPIEKSSQYESYVAKELIALIDKLFPTIATREGRGIMGLSMGGHGAILLAEKHPDVFGSASALSGILKITDHPDKWQIAGRLGSMNENQKVWEENSVYEQAERLENTNVKILFDCGVDDTQTGAINDSRKFHERLIELKIPHIWRELAGTHSWDYWQTHLEEHLNFHQSAMIKVASNLDNVRQIYFERLSIFFDENSQLSFAKPDKPTICLLGSSSMQGFPSDLLPEYYVYNRGIGSDTLGIGTRGISHRLEESVFDMKPNFVFIMNGTNDLGDRYRTGEPSIARMIEEYEKIILKICERLPETKLFVITCQPVRDNYAHLATPTHSFNMQLKSIAEKHKITVIDIYSKLVGEDNLIKPEYTTDGLHLTPEGQKIMAEMMKEAINKK